MFGSTILDVAIGLIMVYLLMSLLCSAIREAIEAIMKTRASDLERGIQELLHETQVSGLTKTIYEHPLIASLYEGTYHAVGDDSKASKKLPSYIPAANFALALMDIAARGKDLTEANATGTSAKLTLDNVRNGIHQIGNARVQRALLTAIDTAEDDLGRAQRNVEAWFNGSMDRVSGWYKRRTQKILFLIGLVVTILLNVNSIGIATALLRSPALRDAVVAQAQQVVTDTMLRKALARRDTALSDTTAAPAGTDTTASPVTTDTTATVPRDTTAGTTDTTATDSGVTTDTTSRDTSTPAFPASSDSPAAGADTTKSDTTTSDTTKKRPVPGSQLIADRIRLQREAIENLGLPIGWSEGFLGPVEGRSGGKWWNFFAVILGWLMTALAITLGAPFWFDLLNKVMVVRSTVKPHEKSPEESSEDRQKGGGGNPPHFGAGGGKKPKPTDDDNGE